MLHDDGSSRDLHRYWKHLLVGLDVVGDEMGYPYIPLTHPTFLSIVRYFRDNGRRTFGMRIHAGESVPRPPSSAFPAPSPNPGQRTLQRAFELHMRVLMTSIRMLYEAIGAPPAGHPSALIRIGHGVAFLHLADDSEVRGSALPDLDCAPADDDDLILSLRKFRQFCRTNSIVFELNPTSNDALLFDSVVDDKPENQRTLRRFLNLHIPVTLCTDDDGVWAIHKCKDHYSHISVAHEYCEAIMRGEIQTKQELEAMVKSGRQAAFVTVKM